MPFLLAQAAATSMAPSAALSSDQWFVLMLVGIGCFTAIVISTVAVFSAMATTIHRRAAQDQLKRELLDRGMNAEEIARVIEASPPENFLDRAASRWKGRR